jgi:hypothetical protein
MPTKQTAKPDAIELLKQDHARVKELFAEFKKFQESKAQDVEEFKQALIDAVCNELEIHTQIEEEIFYPAAREALPDEEDLMNEALVEHSGAKDLIADIRGGSAKDPMTCAQFLVLSEQIDHHVKEEHDEMFPKLRKSSMDLKAVGRQLAARKHDLQGQRASDLKGRMRPSIWEQLYPFGGFGGI